MLKGILLNLQPFKRAIFFPSSPLWLSLAVELSPFQFAHSIEKPAWGLFSLPQKDGNSSYRVSLWAPTFSRLYFTKTLLH